MVENILQHEVLTKFVYPFFLVFFVLFAILEKTKLLGDNKKQINAMVSAVIGLIFVAAVTPKLIVGDLILFLSIAVIVVFIGLLLWGFVSGDDPKIPDSKALKIILGILIVLGLIVVLLVSTGVGLGILEYPFKQAWSKTFWTNAVFLIVIAIALAVALKSSKGAEKGK